MAVGDAFTGRDRSTPFGYLLVHFIEDQHGHKEKIYFSLSDGDTPLRWRLANRGEPVLESRLGTTGVRDPHLVRGSDRWFLIATDLRVWATGVLDWDTWQRHGSRSIVVWESPDLVTWSDPWLLEVAPPTAGMAWAPESTYDAETGEFLVYWSSCLYAPEDAAHQADSYSRILLARTRDFRTVSDAVVLIDTGASVIDTTLAKVGDRIHRFTKDEAQVYGGGLIHEVGSSVAGADFRVLARRVGLEWYEGVEGPLIFADHTTGRWYLWVDQYSSPPQGYVPLTTDDIETGVWYRVPPEQLELAPATKHGVVVSLHGDQWQTLMAAYPPG